MKKLLKAISLYDWGHNRPEKRLAYLVVDMDRVAEYNGTFSHYEACKTDEFETEDQAREHIEQNVAPSHRRYIRLYKRIDL